MKNRSKFLTNFLGWVFIIIGIPGLVLPFLQGFLFIAIGVYLLSINSKWMQMKIDGVKKKYPRFDKSLERVERQIKRIFPDSDKGDKP